MTRQRQSYHGSRQVNACTAKTWERHSARVTHKTCLSSINPTTETVFSYMSSPFLFHSVLTFATGGLQNKTVDKEEVLVRENAGFVPRKTLILAPQLR